MKRIIFKNADSSIGILIPTKEAIGLVSDALELKPRGRIGLAPEVRVIALKDVPEGLPFWVVDTSVVPTDRTFRDAWEADESILGEPDGHGHLYTTFEGVLSD